MKLIRYRRMSDEDQTNSPARQAEAINEHCRQHGHEIVADYLDEGISGTANDTRPELMKMIERGPVNGAVGVIVDQQSRLSRTDAIDTSAEVLYPLRKKGLRFIVDVAKNQIYDLFDTNCSLFMHIEQGYSSHAEAKSIAHRSLTGIQTIRAQGYYLGPRPPFGYKIVDRRTNQFGRPGMGKLAIVEEEAAIIRRVFALYETLKSTRKVAEAMNIQRYLVEAWTDQPIYSGRKKTRPQVAAGRFERMTETGTEAVDPSNKKRRYTGKWELKYIEGVYPEIVTPMQWDNVQRIKRSNCHGIARRAFRSYRLGGKLFCAHCGQKMCAQLDTSKGNQNAKPVYLCASQAHGRTKGEKCNTPKRVKEATVMEAIDKMMADKYDKMVTMEPYREQLEATYARVLADIALLKHEKESALLHKEAELITARKGLLRLAGASEGIYQEALADVEAMMKERDQAKAEIERMATEADIQKEWNRQVERKLEMLANRETLALIERIDLYFSPQPYKKGKKGRMRETATRGIVTFVKLEGLQSMGLFEIVPTSEQS